MKSVERGVFVVVDCNISDLFVIFISVKRFYPILGTEPGGAMGQDCLER